MLTFQGMWKGAEVLPDATPSQTQLASSNCEDAEAWVTW